MPNSHIQNSVSVDPQLGTCKLWIPDSSPMKRTGKNGADIGANILFAYEGGVLNTSKRLWNTDGSFAYRGAIIPGVNDIAGSSLFDIQNRLNINTNGCSFPASYTGTTPAPTPTTLAGDLNGDRVINSIDFSIMNGAWLTNNATSDLNKDGTVNSLDFSIMNSNWLKTY